MCKYKSVWATYQLYNISHTCIYICICICIHIFIYMYIYVYMYINSEGFSDLLLLVRSSNVINLWWICSDRRAEELIWHESDPTAWCNSSRIKKRAFSDSVFVLSTVFVKCLCSRGIDSLSCYCVLRTSLCLTQSFALFTCLYQSK